VRHRSAVASDTWETVAVAVTIVLLPLPAVVQSIIGVFIFVGVLVVLGRNLRDMKPVGESDPRSWAALWAQPIALAIAAVAVLMLLAVNL
jgi:hypothetical protein